jgi:hypothetical protein
MKGYEVVIRIPSWVEKTIYVDDATSKTDARKKAKESLFGDDWGYDMSGDVELGQFWNKAKIMSVKGGE